jgi:hypothetical protein
MGSAWAKHAIDLLRLGHEADIRPRGHSMTGVVNDGDRVVLEPYDPATRLKKGEVVLVKVKGKVFLHLITAVGVDRYQIGNNFGHINGWVGPHAIYGKMKQLMRS